MKMILESYRATRLTYENGIEGPDQKFRVKQVFNTKIDYHPDNRCTCIYSVNIIDVDEVLPFRICAEIRGIFHYDGEISTKEIHMEAARQLFPYLRSSITLLSTLAGAPPFIIQPHEVSPDDIVGKTKEPQKGAN